MLYVFIILQLLTAIITTRNGWDGTNIYIVNIALISGVKVCAISPISGGNDSRKRHEKRLIFKIGTIHPHGLNERFSFIWSYPFIVSVFV